MAPIYTTDVSGTSLPITKNGKLATNEDCCCVPGGCSSDADCDAGQRCCWGRCSGAGACLEVSGGGTTSEGGDLNFTVIGHNAPYNTRVDWSITSPSSIVRGQRQAIASDFLVSSGTVYLRTLVGSTSNPTWSRTATIRVTTKADCALDCTRVFRLQVSTSAPPPTGAHTAESEDAYINDDESISPEFSSSSLTNNRELEEGDQFVLVYPALNAAFPSGCDASIPVYWRYTNVSAGFSSSDVTVQAYTGGNTSTARLSSTNPTWALAFYANSDSQQENDETFQIEFYTTINGCEFSLAVSDTYKIVGTVGDAAITNFTANRTSIQEYCENTDGSLSGGTIVTFTVTYSNPTSQSVSVPFGSSNSSQRNVQYSTSSSFSSSISSITLLANKQAGTTLRFYARAIDYRPISTSGTRSFTTTVSLNDFSKQLITNVTDNTRCTSSGSIFLRNCTQSYENCGPNDVYSSPCSPTSTSWTFEYVNTTSSNSSAIITTSNSGVTFSPNAVTLYRRSTYTKTNVLIYAKNSLTSDRNGRMTASFSVGGTNYQLNSGFFNARKCNNGVFEIVSVSISNSIYPSTTCNGRYVNNCATVTVTFKNTTGSVKTINLSTSNSRTTLRSTRLSATSSTSTSNRTVTTNICGNGQNPQSDQSFTVTASSTGVTSKTASGTLVRCDTSPPPIACSDRSNCRYICRCYWSTCYFEPDDTFASGCWEGACACGPASGNDTCSFSGQIIYFECYTPFGFTAAPTTTTAAEHFKNKALTLRQPKSEVPPLPGTALKNILAWFGIKASENCKCNARARSMDQQGIDWCKENEQEILNWLQEEAKNRGYIYSAFFCKKMLQLAYRLAIRTAKKQNEKIRKRLG